MIRFSHNKFYHNDAATVYFELLKIVTV